jgi:ribonuclease BN (tRNA processing enzyme)
MELTILGSGTSIPSLKRGSPGYLVRSGSTLALMDSGPGTLVRIIQAGFRLEEITHLFYSHTHVDHTADLAPFLFTSRNPSNPRKAPLTIAGSEEFLEFFRSLSELYGPWIEAATFPLVLAELGIRQGQMGNLSVSACRVPHIASSIALRLEDRQGRSLVYSGDTGESDDLAELARGADLLLIEASFPDDQGIEGHLTPSQAGAIAARARPDKVVLTHFYPPCDETDMLSGLRSAYDGKAVLAEDGMRIEV